MAGIAAKAARRPRPWLAGVAAVICAVALALGTRTLQGQARGGSGPTLRYGLSATAISDVNPNDALAARLLFARTIGQAVGYWTEAQAQIFQDPDSIVRATNSDSVDVVAMSTVEFLSLERTMKVDPFVVYSVSGQVDGEYVLLARENVRSLADLAGKRIALYNTSTARDLADTWLDVMLMEAGQPESAKFFQRVLVNRKRSQATLALFFGQVDAAIEPLSAYETAAEMNPQVRQQLKVLARSPRLLQGLACVRRSLDADVRRRYLEKAVVMHELAQYRQTFVVLHVNQIIAFEPRFLDQTRALNDRYLALKRRTSAR
jgi:ABC-type phosphate/phosphonate transport system substrate-binding protein